MKNDMTDGGVSQELNKREKLQRTIKAFKQAKRNIKKLKENDRTGTDRGAVKGHFHDIEQTINALVPFKLLIYVLKIMKIKFSIRKGETSYLFFDKYYSMNKFVKINIQKNRI